MSGGAMNTKALAALYPQFDVTGIDRLPSGRFRVRVQDRGSQARPEPCVTIEEAVALRDAIRDELRRGDLTPASKISVAQWGPTWLQTHRFGNRNYNNDVSRFTNHVAKAAFAKLPLVSVDPADINEWLQDLAGKKTAHKFGNRPKVRLSWQTRKHCLNLVRCLFADAVSAGMCKWNPALGLKVKGKPDEATDKVSEDWPLKPHEISAVLKSVGNSPERWMIAFAIGTGLRQGEMWNLHLADVHLDAPSPHVRVRYGGFVKGKLVTTKTRKPRSVHLFGIGLEAAKAWLEILPTYAPHNPHGLMFPKPKRPSVDGKRGSKGGFRRQKSKTPATWAVAQKALGPDRRIWWHLLRHTCATALLCGWWGKKWSIDEVAKHLGHRSAKTTEMYAHLQDSTLGELAAETNNAWMATQRTAAE